MANYVIDNNGNWSTKKKNKKGTNYTIDTQGNWTSDAPKKVETTVKQIPNYKPTKSIEPTTLPYKPSENEKTKVKTLPYKQETTTEPTTSPALELSYDTKGTKKTFDATEKQNKNIDVKPEEYDKNILDEIAFRGKNVGSGVLSGVTGIAQAPLQELQNDLQKGAQRDANWYNDPKNIALTTADTLLNPLLTMPIKRTYKELYDEEYKKKNFIEKALDNLNDIKEATMPTGLREAVKSYGSLDKQYLGGKAPENVQKLTETISKPSQDVQESIAKEAEGFSPYSQTMGGVWQQVGHMLPSIAATAITKDPDLGLAVMGAGAKGMSTQEALAKGADLQTAINIGDAKALTEILTEKMYGGIKLKGKSVYGTGALDDVVEKTINQKIKKPFINFLAKQGVAVVGEMGEEIVSDVVDFLIDKGTIDPEATYTPKDLWNTLVQTGLSTVLLNFLGGGFTPNAYRNNTQEIVNQNLQQKALNQQAQQEVAKTKGDVVSNLTGKMDEARVLNKQTNVINDAIKKGYESFNLKPTQEVKQTVNTTEYNNQNTNDYNTWYKENFKQLQNKFLQEYNQKITKQTAPNNSVFEAFAKNEFSNQNTQEVDVNKRINEFRKSLQKENIQDKDGFYNAVEKIIKDKNYNVIMDSSITNQNGQSVDAQISNEDGITIKINPKSPRAGEILLMHEVTHAIQNDTINKMIMDYASTNPKFNEALESLKRAYGTNEITPEVAADISGQLFGNQEFINKLATQKPSLFKQIYNEIKYLWHQLRGYKNQNEFIEDLYNKWENAYRKSNIENSQENLKDETKYSKNLDYEKMTFEDAMEGNFYKKNVKTSKTTDDNGRKLTKDQQNFYKDSKVKDENGALITVYHTTTDPVIQFNEFNPVGTPGYLFGDNVVNYFTGEKMSGSYARMFEKADTKRLNNLQDVQEWFFEVGLPFFEVNNNVVYDNSGAPILKYNSFNELLRNLKSDIQREIGNPVNTQYEGYLNIKNPYVVESMDNAWNEVTKELNAEKGELIDLVKEHQAEIDNLMKESKEKRANFDLDEYWDINSTINDLRYTAKMDSDLHYALTNNILEGIKNYNEAQKNAEKLGIKLPSPDTTINELVGNRVYDKSGKERLKRIGDMTFSKFVEKYNEVNQNWEDYGGKNYFWFAKNFEKIVGKDVKEIKGWTNDWESLYDAIDNNFDEDWLKEFTHEDLSTNDVVKRVLEMNKNLPESEKYDGVIFKEIYDYASELDEWEDLEPQDVYVTFNSNQFKAVDNTNPTSDPDIRYSQKADKWRKFVEENFSTEGTRTYFSEKAEKNAMKKTTPKEIVAKNKSGKEIKLKQDSKNSSIYNEEVIKKDLKDITNTYKDRTVTKGDLAVSNFYSNITEKTKFLDTSIREFFKTEEDLKFYNKVTNEESLIEANKRLGKTVQKQQKAFDDFISKTDQFDSVDMAEGWILLQRFNDAADYDRSYLVAKKMKEMGTKSGQAIQMLGLESRLTPEGMYKWAVGELMDAEKAYNSQKGRKKSEIVKYQDSFKLTTQETEFIKNQMEKVEKLKEMNPNDTTTVEGKNGKQYKVSVERAIDIELAKINSMLQDKLPHQKGRSLKSWMRMSMLFNPKTQVRNVVGNSMIVPTNMIADVFGSAADKVVSKYTGVRTLGAPSLGGAAAYVKGFKSGLVEATQDWRMGIDTKDVNQNRFEIGQGKQFNENHTGPFKNARNKVAKKLNAMNDFLGYIMDAGDRGFYRGSMEQSLYNQMKLNGVNEVTNEMAEIATNEGLQRTWNDTNEYTQAVLNLRRSINQIGNQMHVLNFDEYGLGDLMIPFAKTPANLTKAIVDYSPAGFLNVISEGKNLKRAIETGNFTPQMQHDFAQNLGKATAGTLLYAIGVGLAKAGWTTGNSDDDKDLKNFMKDTLGIQPYSVKIKINGKQYSFTYDWAQPVAAPFAITADIEKGMQENMNIGQAIQHFLTTGFNILSQQSFLTGINEVLNNNDGILEGIEQQIVNIPATAIPTFMKQIADMFDTTKRITYTKEGQVANMKKTATSKIPIASKELATQYDVLGNEVEKYGGHGFLYPIKVFLSPSNITSEKADEVAKEIYSLYEATGDKTIIPRKVDYSTKINGETKTLNDKEISAWQKASGELVTKEVKSAMNNSTYKNMNKEQKAQVINKIVNYSYQKAKSETFDTPMSSYYNSVEKAQNKGMGIAEYYISVVNKNSK